MIANWLSLIPPFLVVSTACLTNRLNLALILGIVSAACIATHSNLIAAITLLTGRICAYLTNPDTVYLYSFLILIPSLVDLFIKTDAAAAFTRYITKRIHSKRGIESAAALSCLALGVDDYLSILTVGHVMRSLTDHVGVPRVKLAYLIHSLSGPLVILIPISSWVAPITAYLEQSGIGMAQTHAIQAEPFTVYLRTLPFMFYSLLTLVTVACIVVCKLSFGPMRLHEQTMQPTAAHGTTHEQGGRTADLIIPLATLLVTTIAGILYMGDFYMFGGNNGLLNAFKSNTQIFLVLCVASIVTFGVAVIRSLFKKRIKVSDVPVFISNGFALMKNSLCMLFLISILSGLLRTDLGTGNYLATLLTGIVPITLLPCMLFLVSIGISIATGTSWGTFGLMLPIAVPMLTTLLHTPHGTAAATIPMLSAVLGALFSGALCGDHISPFSETTVMSAVCTQCKPTDHVTTQLTYAVPAIAGCIVAYALSGFLYTLPLYLRYGVPCCAGLITCFITLYLLNNRRHSLDN